MAVVTPLNNFLGPEGDTVTVDEQLLNTEYCRHHLFVSRLTGSQLVFIAQVDIKGEKGFFGNPD
jgi:hypothetical protein